MTAEQEFPHSCSPIEVETGVNVMGKACGKKAGAALQPDWTVSGKVGFQHRGGNVETGGAVLHHRG